MEKITDAIKNAFKNKDPKILKSIAGGFVLGITLLIVSRGFGTNGTDGEERQNASVPPEYPQSGASVNPEAGRGYEEELERRLAGILSKSEGAGKVDVMITIKTGREIIVGRDTETDISDSKEEDSAGGTRELYSESRSDKTIITDGEPLVLTENQPKIEGVIIIAEGGGDAAVASSLLKAAQAVLGAQPHKIQILKMKGE